MDNLVPEQHPKVADFTRLRAAIADERVRELFPFRFLAVNETFGRLVDATAYQILSAVGALPTNSGMSVQQAKKDLGIPWRRTIPLKFLYEKLSDDQLGWLDRRLGASDAPVFVGLHHPPTTIGLELMDPIRLVDGDALATVIGAHPHVVATLVGHAHTMSVTTYAGRPLLVGGGVVSTVTADAEDLATVWYDAPPSLALHLVDPDRRITTHWRALPPQ